MRADDVFLDQESNNHGYDSARVSSEFLLRCCNRHSFRNVS